VEAKRRVDRGKLIFLAVIIVAVALVYISQQSGAELPDWPDDLEAALIQAKKEDRKVLVFFAGSPPSTVARTMSTGTLKKNAKQIKRGKLITVLVQVRKTEDPAKKYGVQEYPTFLLLGSDGKELNRRVGFVGQSQFSIGFLDCSKVHP
jgi:thiol-disulfide isomerase/thioredoxin